MDKTVIVLFIIVLALLISSCSSGTQARVQLSSSNTLSGTEGSTVSLEGTYVLGEKRCEDYACRADVSFAVQDRVYPVLKEGVRLSCVDEYSKEPRKFLRTVCGRWFVDPAINREKKEDVPLRIGERVLQNFTVQQAPDRGYVLALE